MRFSVCVLCLCLVSLCKGDDSTPKNDPPTSKAESVDTTATGVDRIKVAKGFQVERLYSVPRDLYGTWVNLAVDPQGRLITSDESGYLYRLTVPKKGEVGELKVERIPVELGQAQGLLCAFGDLYVMVNGRDENNVNGFYRVRDTNNDDQYDSVELLRKLDGLKDHGPHAILLAPDGKSLYIVCGNNTKLTEIDRSRVPQVWDEDQLLPRVYGAGFMRGTPPPAGCIYHVDPNGEDWELVSSGFRNEFDAAFNAEGELFTFDADMEWDVGTPWYRPTRVCHVVSGADWGWRNGSAKWPEYYADTLPPVVNVGPGSPTGVTFGYGARFPAKYQNALFLCDWTFGKMLAAHLKPSGATYTAELEDFVVATPLPLTDVVINPHDGAMYFTTGGRGVQSGLYRVTYVGDESTAPIEMKPQLTAAQTIRRMLEALHLGEHPDAVEKAWPYLSHSDRFIRHAARTALEHQPVQAWQQRALEETNPQASLAALTALARMFPRSFKPVDHDLDTPPPTFPADGAARNPLQPAVLTALGQLDPASLSKAEKLELLRAYILTLYRLGPPDEATRHELIEHLDSMYPASEREANVLLTELLCYLQAPGAAEKGMKLLNAALTQEEQLDIARSLRFLKTGWTLETRRKFFEWVLRAHTYKGGVNFATFIGEVKADALQGMSEQDLLALKDVIEAPIPTGVSAHPVEARPFVKEWTKEEVRPLVEKKLVHRDFEHGKATFAAANCYNCHRFDGEGGAVGPDLTILSGRFSAQDILESVIEPNKVINDQYAAVTVVTTDGRVITGRISNYSGGNIVINTNMLDPNATETIQPKDIEELETASVSMMPSGLLNTLNESELLDLFAFLLSRGDRNHAMFEPSPAASE
jgi:putative heme-binding domain-containing protein